MPKKYFRREFPGAAFDQAAPAVSIDMLDVKDLLANVLTRGDTDRLMRQLEMAGRGAVDAGAITARHRARALGRAGNRSWANQPWEPPHRSGALPDLVTANLSLEGQKSP